MNPETPEEIYSMVADDLDRIVDELDTIIRRMKMSHEAVDALDVQINRLYNLADTVRKL